MLISLIKDNRKPNHSIKILNENRIKNNNKFRESLLKFLKPQKAILTNNKW